MRFTQQFRGGKKRGWTHRKKEDFDLPTRGEIAISNRKHLFFNLQTVTRKFNSLKSKKYQEWQCEKTFGCCPAEDSHFKQPKNTVAFGGKLQAMHGLIRAIGLVEQWLFRLQIPEMDHLSGRRYGVIRCYKALQLWVADPWDFEGKPWYGLVVGERTSLVDLGVLPSVDQDNCSAQDCRILLHIVVFEGVLSPPAKRYQNAYQNQPDLGGSPDFCIKSPNLFLVNKSLVKSFGSLNPQIFRQTSPANHQPSPAATATPRSSPLTQSPGIVGWCAKAQDSTLCATWGRLTGRLFLMFWPWSSVGKWISRHEQDYQQLSTINVIDIHSYFCWMCFKRASDRNWWSFPGVSPSFSEDATVVCLKIEYSMVLPTWCVSSCDVLSKVAIYIFRDFLGYTSFSNTFWP